MSVRQPAAAGNARPRVVRRKTAVQLARTSAAAARAQRPSRAGGAEAGRAAGRGAPAASWHYAKHVSGYLDPDTTDVRVQRRHVRHAQREVLWNESRIERVRKCGRVPVTEQGQVTIRDNAGVAHYTGLATCGSIWACPVCSAKIRAHRSLEISGGAANWDRQGKSVYMVTLTMPHDYGLSLAKLIPAIADGFRSVISGRAWVGLRERLGIAGTIRSMEVTHGKNGWHPHLHVLVFFGHSLDALELMEFIGHIRRRWGSHIVRSGFRAPNDHGVDVQRCYSAAEAGEYIAKTQDGHSAGNELARGDMKAGRRGSRTPLEILDDFRWSGEKSDLDLWHEYERATRGRQAITWSKGLRDLLQVTVEETDEDVAAAEIGGDDLAVISSPIWKRVVAVPGLSAYLLDRAEAGGIDAVNEALRVHKIGTARPPMHAVTQ